MRAASKRRTSTDAYLCKPQNGVRPELHTLIPSGSNGHDRQRIHASYDAAQDTDEFKNYWSPADALDADSANSRAVREKLVKRARYEGANNGYVDGMQLTHADYLVGTGPTLRMQSPSETFNALVERQWKLWCKATLFRRKLWAQAHAKDQDGEGFGIAKYNPGLNHVVKLDYGIFETEQCQTPYIPYMVDGYIDGIRFDEWGNPIWYDILPYHPGGSYSYSAFNNPIPTPAKFVFHWFHLRRPGQHRNVPEKKSVMNCGAASRRFREATLASAEAAATIAVWLKTQMSPETAADYQPVDAFSTMEIFRHMMTALPAGWDADQLDAKHPNAQYKEFTRSQINEQGRPKSMPVNVAMGDSSDHNFASGKLDHMPWHQRLRMDRLDCNDLVMEPLFALWFDELALALGFASRRLPDHIFDWPVLPVADEKARASANNMDLANGSKTLSEVYRERGLDFEEELIKMTRDYFGEVTDETKSQMRAILRQKVFGNQQSVAAGAGQPGEGEGDAD